MNGKSCGVVGKGMGNIVEESWTWGADLGYLDVDAEDCFKGLNGPKFKPNIGVSR
jgi:hypothetical protein